MQFLPVNKCKHTVCYINHIHLLCKSHTNKKRLLLFYFVSNYKYSGV